MRAALLVVVLAVAGFSADGQTKVTDPVEVIVPEAVAGEWWTGAREDPPAESRTGPEIQGIPEGQWRIDRFDLRNRRWNWAGNVSMRHPGPRLPRDERNEGAAILVRDPAVRHRYGWAEYRKSQIEPVRVFWYSNVAVDDPDARLWSASLEEPVEAERHGGQYRFRGIPDGAAFACSVRDGLSRCVDVDLVAGKVTLAGAKRAGAGIFLLDRAAEVEVRAEGRSIVRPLVLEREHLRAGRWNAVLVPAQPRGPYVFDWRDEQGSVVRVMPDAVPPPPGVIEVLFPAAHGIEVRAFVGANSLPVSESDARLLFLPEGNQSGIPLVIAGPPEEGVFRAPLPAGRYRLKLLASNAPGEFAAASIETGGVEDVRFVPGRSVTGRLVLASTGTVSGDPVVQVVFRTPPAANGSDDAPRGEQTDPVDLIRQVVPDRDGSFEVALQEPGAYALRAQWGSGRAERHFTLTGLTRKIDLGAIELSSGASLQGTLLECAGGELLMTPLPQPGASAVFFDFQRVSVRADGAFSVEGLPAATWILGAVCGGTRRNVLPEMVELTAGAPVYRDLRLTAH